MGVRSSGRDELGLERLILFSDAVFAIAITLLALDIRLPAGAESFGNAEMLRQLLGLWPKYLAYLISFLAIGSFWLGLVLQLPVLASTTSVFQPPPAVVA